MRIALLVILLAAPFLVAEAHILAKATNGVKNVINVALSPIKQLIRPVQSIFDHGKNKAPAAPVAPIAEISNDIVEHEVAVEEEHAAASHEISNDIDEHEEEEKHEGGGHHFGYDEHHGDETWAESFPECAGKYQSPIDFDESIITAATPGQFPPLKFLNYWEKPDKMLLTNNGHAMQISGTWSLDKWPALTGGPLGDKVYQYAQSHIHWGMDDNSGSEHLVNGKAFPLEMHSVHWNLAYGTFDEALKHEDGLTVLGHFGLLQTDESLMLGKFLDDFTTVEGSSTAEHEIDPIPINVLGLDNAVGNYVTYFGSLTTPPCSQIVTWIMSQEPIYFSKKQMEVMRSTVKNSEGENIHNARSVNPLNDRVVTSVKDGNIA